MTAYFIFNFTGMFPYMCLITMPIFCRMDWPKQIISYGKNLLQYPFNIIINGRKENTIKNSFGEYLD